MKKVRKFNKDTCFFEFEKGTIIRQAPNLAKEIGDNESNLLLQLEYWLVTLEGEERDGRKWIYMSLENMRERFPSWSKQTVFRTINSLENNNYISSRDDLNKRKGDRTKWYSINFEACSSLESFKVKRGLLLMNQNVTPFSQKEPPTSQNVTEMNQNVTPFSQNVTTIPETSSETSKITTKISSEKEKGNFLIKKLNLGHEEEPSSPTTLPCSNETLVRNKEKLQSLIGDLVQKVNS